MKPWRCKLRIHKWEYHSTDIWLLIFRYRCELCGAIKGAWVRP